METICGAKCEECMFNGRCGGCKKTCGSPFGGGCIAAEYIKIGGKEGFEAFKAQLIKEINALNIEGMKQVTQLFSLCGSYVNLEYRFPSGESVRLLNDNRVYLGAQLAFADGVSDRRFGVVADMGFILVCTYAENGKDPELVLFKQR